jgi:hypothetical protein
MGQQRNRALHLGLEDWRGTGCNRSNNGSRQPASQVWISWAWICYALLTALTSTTLTSLETPRIWQGLRDGWEIEKGWGWQIDEGRNKERNQRARSFMAGMSKAVASQDLSLQLEGPNWADLYRLEFCRVGSIACIWLDRIFSRRVPLKSSKVRIWVWIYITGNLESSDSVVSAHSRFQVLRWQGQLKHREFQRISLEFRLE